MLKFTLLINTSDEIRYAYYPEGTLNCGVISYDIKTGTCHIIALSSDDSHQKYALKMISRIRKYAQDGNFETEGLIAWY